MKDFLLLEPGKFKFKPRSCVLKLLTAISQSSLDAGNRLDRRTYVNSVHEAFALNLVLEGPRLVHTGAAGLLRHSARIQIQLGLYTFGSQVQGLLQSQSLPSCMA